jgi:hypothetical protein
MDVCLLVIYLQSVVDIISWGCCYYLKYKTLLVSTFFVFVLHVYLLHLLPIINEEFQCKKRGGG